MGVTVELVDNEDKAMIDERSNTKEDGPNWEEGCGCGGGDEDLPLLPLNKLIKSYKSLPFPASTVIGTGDILSSSSFEWVKSIVEVGMDETKTFNLLKGFSSACVCLE